MSRLKETFAQLEGRSEKGLITYLMGGDPDLAVSRDMILSLCKAGADVVEIGIPFSDPLADGPVIQAAALRALSSGTRVSQVFELAAGVREQTEAPLVLMTYYNPVLQYGLEKFCRQAAASGVDGLIVPDLPLEESGDLRSYADSKGIDLVPLVAPTSLPARIKAICSEARGFVYCVAVAGVTGAREQIPVDLEALCGEVRRYTGLPVAVGFGISGPGSAAGVAPYCDAVVVGSALVKLVSGAKPWKAAELAASIKAACNTRRDG